MRKLNKAIYKLTDGKEIFKTRSMDVNEFMEAQKMANKSTNGNITWRLHTINEKNCREWVVYLVECSDKTLYCGITTSLARRLEQHNAGKGARYTRGRGPVKIVSCSSKKMSKSGASKLEYRIRRLPKHKKTALLSLY